MQKRRESEEDVEQAPGGLPELSHDDPSSMFGDPAAQEFPEATDASTNVPRVFSALDVRTGRLISSPWQQKWSANADEAVIDLMQLHIGRSGAKQDRNLLQSKLWLMTKQPTTPVSYTGRGRTKKR